MDQQRVDYIKSIENSTQFVCRGTGLFASVMIAQACLESNNGQSFLSTKYHNHFGIKAGGHWTGKTASMKTGEETKNGKPYSIYALFRVYDDIITGFKDRVHLLQTVATYGEHGMFTAKTAEDQCGDLLKAGYATDHLYPDKLKSIIKIYNLKQYD